MSGGSLVVSHESALEFWRAVRAAAGARDEGDPEGRVYGERRLTVSERAELAASLCGFGCPVHVQVPNVGARHHNPLVVDHVWGGPKTRAAPFALGNGIFVARMPEVFVQLAQQLDELALAEVAYEMTGTYGLAPWSDKGAVGDIRPLVGLSELDAYASDARALGVRGAARASAALRLVVPMSNSPRESDAAIYFILHRSRGGLDVGGFALNKTVRLPRELASMVGSASIKPDYSWDDRVLVEYDSDQEHRISEQISRDERKRIAYKAKGMDCLTLTNEILSSNEALNQFSSDLESSLGVRRRPPNERMLEKRAELRERLFGPERTSAALKSLYGVTG